MMGKTAAVNGDSGNSRPKPGAGRPDPTALAQTLERLREELLQRLAVVESVAMEHVALSGYDPSEREQILRERASTLEASLSRIQAELKRRELEWEEQLESLQHDRKLITQAWERLEEEQIQAGTPASVSPREAPPPDRAATTSATYRPPTPDESNDQVTKAILKQFQALQGDVRRNAKGRTTR